MKCSCGKYISQYMKGKCMECRYKEAQSFKRCPACGKWFKPVGRHRSLQVYCSEKCRIKNANRKKELERKPKTCRGCGREFMPSRYYTLQVYCSEECRKKTEREHYRAYQYVKTCDRCGKTFVGSQGRLFCSDECRFPKKYGKKRQKMQKPAEPVKRFLKPGIIPPIAGWNGPIGNDKPQGPVRAVLKCDPRKLPARGIPTRPVRRDIPDHVTQLHELEEQNEV